MRPTHAPRNLGIRAGSGSISSLYRLAGLSVAVGLWLTGCATVALADQEDTSKALAQTSGSGSPTVAWYRTFPTVVRSDRTAPVAVTIKITGGVPDKVALVLAANNSEILLHDDGLNGDAVAGDTVYSALVPAATVTGGLQAADVFRRFLGFGDVYLGATRVVRVNVFAQIWTPAIGTVSVTSPDAQTQYSSYVLNVVDAAAFATSFATLGSADFRPVAQRLYQRFPDIFDFIDLVIDRANIANRYHFGTKNSTLGIGTIVFDTNASYGSAGRLQGVSVFPSNVFFDGADDGHAHELGHQWYRPAAVAVPLGTPFTANVPTLYTHPWTAADQRGGHVFFIAALKTGALAGGALTNDQILGLAAAPFSLP